MTSHSKGYTIHFMGIFTRFFGKKTEPPRIDHPLFGTIEFSKHDGWQNMDFPLWGRSNVELIVDSGTDGPTRDQEEAFRRFEESREVLLPRCLDALEDLRGKMEMPPGTFVISGLTVPSLGEEETGKLWTLWFDCEGDEDFWYGVQTDDDWQTLSPFADD